jgi:hypothetical protein
MFFGSISQESEKFLAKKVTELYIGREPRYLLYGTAWPISDMGFYSGLSHQSGYKKVVKRQFLGFVV